MTQFPIVDPISLPAPVWLFKLLHNLTFALHLGSVDLLLGGLVLAIAFRLMGHAQPAGIIVRRLPKLMAFVINLGIPPLLFAQVLYERALYSSSVLIGTFWFSVILLLMGSYYGLYAVAKRAEEQRSWVAPGFAALLLILTITFIYSNNMTLMLRPQIWPSMYQSSPAGFQLNTGDPTLIARWFFFVAGAFPVAGAALALLALRAGLDVDTRRFVARGGGVAMAAGMLFEGTFADLAYAAQSQIVMSSVMHDSLYVSFAYGWIASAVLLFVVGLLGVIASSNPGASRIIAITGGFTAFLNVAALVMVRDAIRDVTLRAGGFDVWNRVVVTNWSVVGIFLILFLAAIAAIMYLNSVAQKARRLEEKFA